MEFKKKLSFSIIHIFTIEILQDCPVGVSETLYNKILHLKLCHSCFNKAKHSAMSFITNFLLSGVLIFSLMLITAASIQEVLISKRVLHRHTRQLMAFQNNVSSISYVSSLKIPIPVCKTPLGQGVTFRLYFKFCCYFLSFFFNWLKVTYKSELNTNLKMNLFIIQGLPVD